MKINIAVLPGDGIGPEIVEQALNVTKAVCEKFGHELTYKTALVGAAAIDACGDPYPEETHQLCMASDAVLLPSKTNWFDMLIFCAFANLPGGSISDVHRGAAKTATAPSIPVLTTAKKLSVS